MTVTTETTVFWQWGVLVIYVVVAIAVIAIGIWLGLWISVKTGVLGRPAPRLEDPDEFLQRRGRELGLTR